MFNIYKKLKRKINIRIWLSIKKNHKYFLKEKKLNIIREIKSDFFDNNFDLKVENYSSYIFTDDNLLNNKIIKQYVAKNFSGNKFFYLFYFFYKKKIKGIYCLPTVYLEFFQKQHNININFFISKLLFFVYVLKEFLSGCIFMLKIFLKVIKNKFKKRKTFTEPYVLFFDFSCKNFNIVQDNFNLDQFNIINWLIKNNSCKKIILQGDTNFSYEKNEVKIISNKDITDAVLLNVNTSKFIYKSLFFFISTLKNLILYNWWNVILFREGLESLCFKYSNAKLANTYYGVYSSNIYKPLWTYIVEQKNSRVELLAISSLTDLEHIETGKKFDYEGIRLYTWNNITLWNKASENYILKRDITKKNIIKVLNSHIYYKDTNQRLNLPPFSVAVFLYENHRFNLSNSFLSDWVLSYTTDLYYLNKKFWDDLLFLREKYNFSIILKKKRDFPKKFDYKRNLNFNNWLIKQTKVIQVDNNIAVERIIQNSKISISMPFTSPSIIARYLNKKSIYYDPTNLLNSDDPNSSGVQIVKGRNNLDEFFANFLNKRN